MFRNIYNEEVHKRKSLSLFQYDYIQLQSAVSSITSWKHPVQAVPSKKKKTFKKEKEQKNEAKRKEEKKKKGEKKRGEEREGKERGGKEEKKKRDGRSLCRRKGKRKNERWQKRKKEGEGEERREREREKENGENGARGVLSSPNAFPSTKLGNNMTPIKGRLGKNTTPTSRSSIELNQNLHNNPQQRQTDFDASSRTNFSYAPEGSKYKFYSKGATIYKKAETLGNPCKRLKFSINQH